MKKFRIFLYSFLACFLMMITSSAVASPLLVAGWIIGGLVAYGATLTATLALWGDNIFNFLFNQYSECYTCKYVSRILDYTIVGSNRLYEVLAPYIMIAIPLCLVFYMCYLVLMSFWERKTDNLNATSMYKTFAPKVFAMFFAFALLAMPTPKVIFQYVINPSLSLATTVAVKMTELGGGTNAQNHYVACMVEKQEWEDETAGSTDNENYFKDVQKQMTCLTKQVEMMNATGLIVGNMLVLYAGSMEYNWIFLIPNLGMLIVGFIIMGLYFTASFTFAFYILEVFLQLFLVFLFMPFTILSYVLTRGGDFPRIKAIPEKSIKMIVSAMFTLVFLCLLLSIVHLINQTTWGQMNSYTEILNAIKNGDHDYIIQNVYFGSKSFLYLILSPIISVLLLSQASTLASKMNDVVFSDKLAKSFEKNTRTILDKTKTYGKKYAPQAKKGYEWTKGKVKKGYKWLRGRP